MAKLYFYYSAMNAGKTTNLLQSNFNYHERGLNTLLFTPAIDTRFGYGKIVSRIGISEEAIPFDKDFSFFQFVEKTNNNLTLHCIFVDEAQFLTKEQVLDLGRIADELDVAVLTYGLRSDFMGEPFEGSKYLLTIADHLCEIKTICHCGSKATMNAKIDGSGKIVTKGEQIDIGGNEKYISLCRMHYSQSVAQKQKELEKKALGA